MIGRNEGARLDRCLRSLAMIGIPVVYVDSGSVDGSAERAAELGAWVTVLTPDRPYTASRARREGAERLGEAMPDVRYVQFVDGDCEVDPDWIDAALASLESDDELVAVCGRRRERFPDASFYNRLCDEEWDTPVGDTLSCGGDALMRVSALLAAGNFDPAMVAHEEPELCARLRARGGVIRRIDAPMTVHDADMHRFGQWWRRSVRAGFGYAQAFSRMPGTKSGEAKLLGRALTWSFVVVAAIALLALGWWRAACLPLLVLLLQFIRLALRRRAQSKPFAARVAVLTIVSKFAEALGAARFALSAATRRRQSAILYK